MLAAAPRLIAPPAAARTIADLVLDHARAAPARPAIVLAGVGGDRVVTFGALGARIAAYAAGLRAAGLPRGARVMLLARPDEEIQAAALAALACGMTVVLVDGRAMVPRLLAALRDAAPDVVVAPPALLCWWPLIGALRRARRVSTARRIPGTSRLADLPVAGASEAAPAQDVDDRPAIVSFTSASTGRAKAVVRTHAVLLAQHRALRAAFPMDGGANLPGFPAATLHNLCCGVTTIIPGADLRAMVDADPATVLACIERHGVTSVSGAPAFLARLATYVVARGAPVTGVRGLVIGGGPVGRALAATLIAAFPNAEGHVVYGATEAEPIASATLGDVATLAGQGFLVGRPTHGTELALLAPDGTHGTAGEIIVRGKHVVGAGAWHHTGDVATRDALGRLWLLGRSGDAGGGERPLWPFGPEAAALAVPGVRAAACLSHTRAPAGELLIACDRGARVAVLAGVRRALADEGLGELPVRAVDALPMDARHGSKVVRAELRRRIERGTL